MKRGSRKARIDESRVLKFVQTLISNGSIDKEDAPLVMNALSNGANSGNIKFIKNTKRGGFETDLYGKVEFDVKSGKVLVKVDNNYATFSVSEIEGMTAVNGAIEFLTSDGFRIQFFAYS